MPGSPARPSPLTSILKRAAIRKGVCREQVRAGHPLAEGLPGPPMILCNTRRKIEPLIDKELLEETISICLHEVMEVFYRDELGSSSRTSNFGLHEPAVGLTRRRGTSTTDTRSTPKRTKNDSDMDFNTLAQQHKTELLERACCPFWLEHSQIKTYGGYFTRLDCDGSVYDTDKFIWLQDAR